MLKAYSQKLAPPYSGVVQLVESDPYRAITLDGQMWEIQYINRIHVRAATISTDEIRSGAYKTELLEKDAADPVLTEFMEALADLEPPFPSEDHFECWMLDAADKAPLAMLYSCSQPEQMRKFPKHPDWTALPDSVMSVPKTEQELEAQQPPVNYRVEMLVSQRAGQNKKAQWFDRREHDAALFPPLLVREDWADEQEQELVWRYLARQAPRLLMLSSINDADRERLEEACKPNAIEVARFSALYPKIINQTLINSLLVQARIRSASESGNALKIQDRRDGVLYI